MVAVVGVGAVVVAAGTVVVVAVLAVPVCSIRVSGHMPRNCDAVEPYRPAWYDGQNCEEQTRQPSTLGSEP